MCIRDRADTAAIVPQNRVPALVVMGSRDPDFEDAAAEARWLAGQLGAESLIVEGAGHYPHTEMPDRVAPKLLAFIAKAHGRPSRTTLNGLHPTNFWSTDSGSPSVNVKFPRILASRRFSRWRFPGILWVNICQNWDNEHTLTL